MEFKHIVMRILKNTEWNNEITSVGYNAVTKIEDTDEVEVEVREITHQLGQGPVD